MRYHGRSRSPLTRAEADGLSDAKGARLGALEIIAAELERLRVLKEHELGVRLEEAPEGNGPYVPNVEK